MSSLNAFNEWTTDGDDHLYYNSRVSVPVQQTYYSTVEFNDSRTEPFLENPSEYYMSVVRFKIPTNNIPLFVFQPGAYQVQLQYNGASFTDTLLAQDGGIYTTGPFAYSVYEYWNFIMCVNASIARAFTALRAANLGFPATHAPFVSRNNSAASSNAGAGQAIFSLYAEAIAAAWSPSLSAGSAVGTGALLLFNPQLYPFFNTMPSEAVTANGTSTNSIFWEQIVIGPNNGQAPNIVAIQNDPNSTNGVGGNNPWGGTYPYNALQTTQETTSTWYWSRFQSLVFVSGSLPISTEFVPQSTAPGTGNTSTQSSSNSTLAVITDFEPDKTSAIDRAPLQYYPNGPYRLIDMKGSSAQRSLSIQVFWQDSDANLSPVYMNPGDYASIKLMFRRKRLGL
jgi:hypothetical protein